MITIYHLDNFLYSFLLFYLNNSHTFYKTIFHYRNKYILYIQTSISGLGYAFSKFWPHHLLAMWSLNLPDLLFPHFQNSDDNSTYFVSAYEY